MLGTTVQVLRCECAWSPQFHNGVCQEERVKVCDAYWRVIMSIAEPYEADDSTNLYSTSVVGIVGGQIVAI